MTNSGMNLHSGDIMHVHMTYDGTTLTLLLTDTVTNASFTASDVINIPSTIRFKHRVCRLHSRYGRLGSGSKKC